MVKIQRPSSEYDRLEQLVREVLAEHGDLHLDVTGWTRKTFDVYAGGRHDRTKLLVRVESFATTNGEVRVYDDAGLPVAEAIAARLEKEFDIGEAVVIRG